ncbi:hypothetical protein BST81_19935 [Leptolyngbya sp. 'hensonii']|nr:hypothetical protein BST81_19935 [Leptolyngbya sp. 'hensonii']
MRQYQLHRHRQQIALIELAKNHAFYQGDLTSALQTLTRTAAHTLAVERVSVWFYDECHTQICLHTLYEHQREEFSSGVTLQADRYPTYFQALEKDDILAVHETQADLRTQALQETWLLPYRITSLLDAPIRSGGVTVGVLCHEHTGPARHWTLEEQNFARHLAQMVSLALEARDRQQAEEALRRSEERWQLALQANHQGIWDWDILEGRTFYSDRWKEMLGYNANEIGQTQEDWYSRIHPEDYDLVMATLWAYLDRKIPDYITEYRLRCKDGSYKWIQAQGQAIWDGANRPIRMVGSHTDATARKQQEEALHLIVAGTAAKTADDFFRSCVRYLAAVLQVRYALVTTIVDQHSTRVRTLAFWKGDNWASKVEYELKNTPCEIVFSGHPYFYPNDVQERFPADLKLAELDVVSYLGIPLADQSGRILGHLAVLDSKPMTRDIDRELILRIFAARAAVELERKLAEAALQNSEAEYRALVQAANCIILRWDTAGQIIFMNDYGLDFFGFEQSQLLGHNIIGTIVPETELSGRSLTELMRDICRNPEQHLINENENIRRDGKRVWIAWANKPIVNPEGIATEILSIGTDISERKQAEQALEQAKQEAEAANRVKSEFLANMSHELRTPLNAILGFAQLMTRDPTLNGTQHSYLSIINNSGEHLLALINDVLDMAKIEAGQIHLHETSFNLHHLLDPLADLFRLKSEAKGIQFIFYLAPAVPPQIAVDEGKLRQILINLLSNAIKFTQQGRVTLRVSLENSHLPSGLQHSSLGPGPDLKSELGTGDTEQMTLSFEVEDTGPGIDPEELETIFAPFVQTGIGRTLQGGTGLGLSISRRFAQLMQGNITVSSCLGQGSCFCLKLPVRPEPTISTIQTPRPRVIGLAPNQPTYRILVVEDRWESRHLLVRLLETLGFELREAQNGLEAITLWEEWQPHLIWMDMQMPVMDGYEATRHIKTQLRGQATVVIALTASALEEEKTIVLSAGCDDFVRKPFQESIILQKIADYLGVRYLYEEESQHSLEFGDTTSAAVFNPLEDRIKPDSSWISALRSMPNSWITQLHEAATLADNELILQLIEAIPESCQALAQDLTALANYFRCDKIMDLTASALAETSN